MAFGQSFIPALIDLVTGLGFFLVLLLAGEQIISGKRTLGEFMSFFTAMSLAFQPLRRLGALAGTWQVAAASLERIYAFLTCGQRWWRRPCLRRCRREPRCGLTMCTCPMARRKCCVVFRSRPKGASARRLSGRRARVNRPCSIC
jgi:ABC-type multidrug transport system fused ATPase/permease subunit